jgi:hypothetical protein
MSWRRKVAGLAVGAAVAAMLAGCASVNGAGDPQPYSASHIVPDSPLVAARSLPNAPAWVLEEADTDCGAVAERDTGSLPADALECLKEAAAVGATATLAWVVLTTEGDPLPHFARASGAGVLVASTSEYDAYGSGGWHQYECASPDDVPTGESCANLP